MTFDSRAFSSIRSFWPDNRKFLTTQNIKEQMCGFDRGGQHKITYQRTIRGCECTKIGNSDMNNICKNKIHSVKGHIK